MTYHLSTFDSMVRKYKQLKIGSLVILTGICAKTVRDREKIFPQAYHSFLRSI